MNNPLVSFIIPAYNAEKWISRAINSILDQTYPNIEIIVVDDGSTDDTAEICCNYGNKIKYLQQQNSGVSAARNNGIKYSNGSYVGFLDSDDQLFPEMVNELISVFYKFPTVHAVSGAHILNSGKKKRRRPPKGCVLRHNSIGILNDFFDIYRKYHTLAWTGAILINKKVFEHIGCFRDNLRFGEDTDMWIRIAGKYQWAYLDKPVAIYNHNPESSSTLKISAEEKSLSAIYNEEEMKYFIDSSLWNSYRRFRRDRAATFARVLFLRGNDEIARKALSQIPPAPWELRWKITTLFGLIPRNSRKLIAKLLHKES